MNFQWWNMFFNCSIFPCSVQNWDKKLHGIFLRSLSHIFNDKWSTWEKIHSYGTQSFQKIKVPLEFVIISYVLLLTFSYNYFVKTFLIPKTANTKPRRPSKIIPYVMSSLWSTHKKYHLPLLALLKNVVFILVMSGLHKHIMRFIMQMTGRKSKLGLNPHLYVYLMVLISFSLSVRPWSDNRITLF